MNMGCKIIFAFIFTVLLLGIASADFIFSDVGSSITTEYDISDYLKAKINISFQNEPLNSSFKDSFGNSINISDLLKKIPAFGYNSAPSVFYKDSSWYIISGKGNGGFYGFKWSETAWASDITINKSLPDIGDNSTPYVFYKDESWYLLAGESNGYFKGFAWDASTSSWAPNSTINNSLPDIGDNSVPFVFYKDSSWYLISGSGDGKFYGFNWSGTNWLLNSTINKSLPDVGDNSAPSVFYKDSSWYLISGKGDGKFYGYTWNGGTWTKNLTINSSLPDVGDNSAPSVFNMTPTNWYLISGKGGNGGFYGFKWGGTAWASDITINASLPDIGYTINPVLKTISSDFYVIPFENARFTLPNSAGTFPYQLNLTKRDSPPLITKQIFKKQVKMVSSSSAIENEIARKNEMLTEAKKQINNFDILTQKILNGFLNITSIENDLNKIEIQYENAYSDEEYAEVLENLSSIKVPEEISETAETNSITFYPDREIINLDILKSIGGGDYEENEEEYIDSIYFWNEDNLKTKITFKEILILYGLNEEAALRIFQFEFDKENMEGDAYFIVEKIDNLKFGENYSKMEDEEPGYFYINLNDISDKIIFSTTEDVDFLSVPVFISPVLDNLNLIEAGDYIDSQQENKLSKWLLFGLIIFLLLLVSIIAYVILQTWYRRKYENYLFKNRNNLYNIMTYIQNAKKKGMERGEIIKNLKKADWTGEQINYALRKYEGKKIIGIIEKPFKKVIEEIEKKP